MRALDANGTAGAWSSIVSVTYKQTLPAPTVTGGNDAQGRPTLKWKVVTGAAKYEVYRARSLNGDYIKYSTVTGTSYTNTSYIEDGNTYYYKVRALEIRRHGRCVEQHRVRDLQANSVRPHRHRRQ